MNDRILKKRWEKVLSLPLSEAQHWFLSKLRECRNKGLIPNVFVEKNEPLLSYTALQQINRKLRVARLPLVLTQVGKGSSYGDKPFRLVVLKRRSSNKERGATTS